MGGVEEGEEKVCSGESRCRPPSQRNFDGGSDAPVGETLSHFLRVSSQSDGGFSPLAQPLGSCDLFAGINYQGCAQTAFPASLIRHINKPPSGFSRRWDRSQKRALVWNLRAAHVWLRSRCVLVRLKVTKPLRPQILHFLIS